MSIGARLREERERLKLTQPSIAQAAGTTKQTQHAYETNRTPPKASYLAEVASLGVDVAYVVTGTRLENSATTPTELAYLRICRRLADVTGGQQAGNAALLGVLASYGLELWPDERESPTDTTENKKQAALTKKREKNE